jgi:hypothetical protein
MLDVGEPDPVPEPELLPEPDPEPLPDPEPEPEEPELWPGLRFSVALAARAVKASMVFSPEVALVARQ